MNRILFFILFFFSFVNYAQESYLIQGQVLDINTQQPLESANVYFSSVKDSLKLGTTTSDKTGMFKILLKKNEKPTFLNISYVGHEKYKEEITGINENKDFGTIFLFSTENVLKDVVIKTAALPMVIKQDTIEYNAASFKVRPDDNVEAVLKELPGFVIDDEGKITVNGKEVNQVLVNGKSFFGKDGAVALQNLPADIINKIQVSDFKTKKEELAGEEAASDFMSINLTIDEKKNKGYFGKFLGGYGTDDRYEGSFLVNQFDKKQRISAVGSINNINLTGFSIDETFNDNKSKGNKDVGAALSRKGITKSNLAGLNYFNEWSDKLETTADYSFNNSVNSNEAKSTQLRFLPNGDISTNSNSKSKRENSNHKVNLELIYKPTKTVQIVVEPRLRKSNNKNNGSSSSISTNEAKDSLNGNQRKSLSTTDIINFDNEITINKRFEKKSRNLGFSLITNHANNDNVAYNNSTTKSYTKDETVLRNQKNDNNNHSGFYYAQFEYTEPVSDYIKLSVGVDYKQDNKVTDEKTYNYDASNELYSILNEAQSSYISSKLNSISPKMVFSFNNKIITFWIRNNSTLAQYDNYSVYLNNKTNLKSNYFLPDWNTQFRYKIDKSNYALLKYMYKVNLPSAYQLLPVLDISSTVNTVIGNPDLEPVKRHSFHFDFRNYNVKKRSGYNLFVKADIIDSDIISTRNFAEDGTSKTTFINIYDVYSTSLGANWNNYIKKGVNTYRYGFGFRTNYSFNKGFNNVFYEANVLSFVPNVYLSYNYSEFFTIAPSYNFTYNESRYENYSISSRSNLVHKLNLSTTNYFGKKWVLSNDFGYRYNSGGGAGFRNDFQLWNMSLGYTFLNKTLTTRVKVFDILNQNQGYTRSITDTSIRDEESTVLKRYAMFSLIYKIKNFGGLKPPGYSGSKEKVL